MIKRTQRDFERW